METPIPNSEASVGYTLLTPYNYEEITYLLQSCDTVSFDCEATGLRPFHGDRPFMFSFCLETHKLPIVSFLGVKQTGFPQAKTLPFQNAVKLIKFGIFGEPKKTVFGANIKYDLHMFKAFFGDISLPVNAKLHDTMVVARLLNNTHMSYSLDSCVKRDLGLEKSKAVDEYIDAHNLWTWEEHPGKKARTKLKHFDKVPWGILAEYAALDARLTYQLGEFQVKELAKDLSLERVVTNELKLIHTVANMERNGVRIDRTFCRDAARFEVTQLEKFSNHFKSFTGRDFIDSGKVFAEIFLPYKSQWKYTEKGNPSFETDVLKTFESEAASAVVGHRTSKARANFLNGFLYHSDEHSRLHTHFNQAGTVTGRFSSSQMNLQNMTDEDEGAYKIRGGIIPHNAGDYLVSFDYDQVEYRLLIEYSQEIALAKKVNAGLDVHTATGEMFGVSRHFGKTLNFAQVYGQGNDALAAALKISPDEAKVLRARYFTALPNIKAFIGQVTRTAEVRGYVFTWLGRKLYFHDPNFAYKATNALIQGGCADVIKVAMNRIHAFLQPFQTKMIMTVHDELVFNMPPSETALCGDIRRIMQSSFDSKLLPLTVGCAYSRVSLADLQPGFPGDGLNRDAKTRDGI